MWEDICVYLIMMYFFRIGLSLFFIIILSKDSERSHKSARTITHTLVVLSSCILEILQIEMFQYTAQLLSGNPNLRLSATFENHRIITQIITGIGFLGGLTIVKTQDRILGLITAAIFGQAVLPE